MIQHVESDQARRMLSLAARCLREAGIGAADIPSGCIPFALIEAETMQFYYVKPEDVLEGLRDSGRDDLAESVAEQLRMPIPIGAFFTVVVESLSDSDHRLVIGLLGTKGDKSPGN